MTLAIGDVLTGRVATYNITKVLKEPTVFQAQVLPVESTRASRLGQL